MGLVGERVVAAGVGELMLTNRCVSGRVNGTVWILLVIYHNSHSRLADDPAAGRGRHSHC